MFLQEEGQPKRVADPLSAVVAGIPAIQLHGCRQWMLPETRSTFPMVDPVTHQVRSYRADQTSTSLNQIIVGRGNWNLTWKQSPSPIWAPLGLFTLEQFGGRPNDPTFNNRDAICWATIYAAMHRGTVWFEGRTWYYRGTIEIRDGVTWKGGTLKVMPDDRVIEHLASDYDTTQNEARLACNITAILQHSDCHSFSMEDMVIDGSLDQNLGFLTDPRYDTDPGSLLPRSVSRALRESPVWCGLGITVHGNRVIQSDLRVSLRNVEIRDFGGSCVLCDTNHDAIFGENVRIGNSMSGRVLYGGAGHYSGLHLFGQSRTSVHRSSGNFTCHGYTYTWNRPDGSVPVRRWEANQIPNNICGLSAHLDTAMDQVSVTGVDIDMTGSPFFNAFSVSGDGVYLQGTVRKTDNVDPVKIVSSAQRGPNQKDSMEGFACDLVAIGGDIGGIQVLNAGATGSSYFRNARINVTCLDDGESAAYPDNQAVPSPRWPKTAAVINVNCEGAVTDPVQTLRIRGRFLKSLFAIICGGISASNAMRPLRMVIEGPSEFDNDANLLISKNGVLAPLPAGLPIEILFDPQVEYNSFPVGQIYQGGLETLSSLGPYVSRVVTTQPFQSLI